MWHARLVRCRIGASTKGQTRREAGAQSPRASSLREAAGPPKGANLARKIPGAGANADCSGSVVRPPVGAYGCGGGERRRAVARMCGGTGSLPQRPLGDPRNDGPLRFAANGLPLDGVAHDTKTPLFALYRDHTPPFGAPRSEQPSALATANFRE
jgi:hypothetical protein